MHNYWVGMGFSDARRMGTRIHHPLVGVHHLWRGYWSHSIGRDYESGVSRKQIEGDTEMGDASFQGYLDFGLRSQKEDV